MRKFNVMENSYLSADKIHPIYRLVDTVTRMNYPSDLAADFFIDEITERVKEILLMTLNGFYVDVKAKKGNTAYSFYILNLGRDTQDYYLDCLDGTKLVFSKHAYSVTIKLAI